MNSAPEIRPILKLKLTKTDYLLEAAALLGLFTTWSLAAIAYHNLPELIPTHFGINGKADDWGNKITVFILPAISMVLIIGMSILNRFPHKFNYPAEVTQENALIIYSKGTRLIRILKVLIVVIFLIIEFQVCKPVGYAKLPTCLFILIFSIPVFLPVFLAFTFTKYFRVNKKDHIHD